MLILIWARLPGMIAAERDRQLVELYVVCCMGSGVLFMAIGVLQYAATAERVAMWLPATARNDQIQHPSSPSFELIPNTTPTALLIQMTTLDQVAEMLFQRVAADARQFDRIADCDAPVLAGKLDDLK